MFRSLHLLVGVAVAAAGIVGCGASQPSAVTTGVEGICQYQAIPGPKDAKPEKPEPRSGVIIKLKALTTDETLYEAESGRDVAFSFQTKPGKYRFFAELPGKHYKISISIRDGHVIEVIEGTLTRVDFTIYEGFP